MRVLILTRGQHTVVDDHVYEWASRFKWHALKDHNTFYAARCIRTPEGKKARVLLHREILNAASGIQVDHVDGDGLNNLDDNLRTCEHRQNMRNRQKNLDSYSRYKGVIHLTTQRAQKKWRAQIRVHGYRILLGVFHTEVEAARAYDKASSVFHGEFSRPNFPKETHEKV